MVLTDTDELGQRFANDGDVISGFLLSDRLIEKGELEQSEKVFNQVTRYVSAWENISNQMQDAFHAITFDFESTRWRDAETGRFATSPNRNEDFVNLARERRLRD